MQGGLSENFLPEGEPVQLEGETHGGRREGAFFVERGISKTMGVAKKTNGAFKIWAGTDPESEYII